MKYNLLFGLLEIIINKEIWGVCFFDKYCYISNKGFSILKEPQFLIDELPQVSLVVLINDKNEILSVSRKFDHSDFGLIGGKVQNGESIETAAIRETKEETGLNISDLRCIYKTIYNGAMCHTFVANYNGEIHTDEQHVVKWNNIETINNGRFGEYNKVVTSRLIDMDYIDK